nr:radical SAM protein [Lachnospiraceae bacterium]
MYHKCTLCPRECHTDRNKRTGFCNVKAQTTVARAALHMWEEPCISGDNGSGAVFFSGCSLGCVFCQNHRISGGEIGKEIPVERLTEIFFELEEQGANNVNLVTPDHYVPSVCEAVERAHAQGFSLPFIYNCSGYEKTETLRMLEGLIDVYLPDFKYWKPETAKRYCNAPDYPERAKDAVAEMVRQTGACVFDGEGRIRKGTIVRHLLLPGHVGEAKQIIDYLYGTYQDDIYISLMNQFTPVLKNDKLAQFPELHRKVTKREYDRLVQHALDIGVTNAFIQEGETAGESFIPMFDLAGVERR